MDIKVKEASNLALHFLPTSKLPIQWLLMTFSSIASLCLVN